MPSFSVGFDAFLLDGEPFQIRAGALHYFRVHPGQWEDRIAKAKLMGLNAIETYVPWNWHAPRPGEFRLDGWHDLGAFLDLVRAAGMYAIVRPGPYICAEWAGGGLPAWLAADPNMAVRTNNAPFLARVAQYFDALLPVVAERQVTKGGPVILVQIENEYGAFGDDPSYLRALADMVAERGIAVPMVTCDQASDGQLERGGLPELLSTVTFGSRAAERLAVLRRHQPAGPLMCMEYWIGWFDSWGSAHHITDAAPAAEGLSEMMELGASFSVYMFHGGTNFGLTNGANHKGIYAPIATSYDYDAPLGEDGHPGPKFGAFKAAIARHASVPEQDPPPRPAAPTFTVPLRRALDLPELIGGSEPGEDNEGWRRFDRLPTMEEVDPAAQFVWYRAAVRPDDDALGFAEVRDMAFTWVNGRPTGVMYRHGTGAVVPLPPGEEGTALLLVEDLGRVDYGRRLGETKGLVAPARTATREVRAWEARALDLDRLRSGPLLRGPDLEAGRPVSGPLFASGRFDAPVGADLYLDTTGWGHGLVWLNGFFLGRYWNAGPTRTLYVPGPLVRAVDNDIRLLELASCSGPELRFVAWPDLGPTEQ
ncbi:MAG: beta-galactosidase [Bifidobacteriaceae bacterium]|jgi:beta-galactosidase|nr:beta-galactosidase [Bifidobacteriaceae bacterium]